MPVQTHINAYYRDLADAKQEVAVAQGKVDLLEEQIKGMGGELPEGGEVVPLEPTTEDAVTAGDVSAAEQKPEKSLSKMNRAELNAKASEVGVEAPEELDTNADVIKAIKETK